MTTPSSPDERNIFQQVVLGMPTPARVAAAMISTPPAASVSRRWGTINAINSNGTVNVNIGGVIISGVRRLATYTPTVGETVTLDVVNGDVIVNGTLPPSPLNDYGTRTASLEARVSAKEISTDAGIAKYTATIVQTIPNSSDTLVAFSNPLRTSSLVSQAVSGAGHTFTLMRGGLWSISTTVRFVGNTNGERYASIFVGSNTIVEAQGNSAGGGFPVTRNVAATDAFVSGDKISVNVFQSSGAPLDLELGPGGLWVHVTLSWIRP